MSRNQHIQGNLPGSVRRNLDGTFTVGPFSTVSGGRSAVFENVTVSPGSTFLLGNDNVFSPMPSREAGTTTESNSARSASSAASIEAIRTTVNDLRSQLQNPRLTLEAREALERALRDAEEGLLKAESEPSASQGATIIMGNTSYGSDSSQHSRGSTGPSLTFNTTSPMLPEEARRVRQRMEEMGEMGRRLGAMGQAMGQATGAQAAAMAEELTRSGGSRGGRNATPAAASRGGNRYNGGTSTGDQPDCSVM